MTKIILILSFCLSVVTGCTFDVPSAKVTQGNAPPLKSFQCPDLSFNYPNSLFEKDTPNGNFLFMATTLDPAEDRNNISIYDLQELVVLNVIKKIQPKQLNPEELRRASIKDIQQLGKVTLLSTDQIFQDHNPVLEFILSTPQGSLHMKQYLHNAKNGDILVIAISTPEDNWNNTTDVVQTLEKSLRFR